MLKYLIFLLYITKILFSRISYWKVKAIIDWLNRMMLFHTLQQDVEDFPINILLIIRILKVRVRNYRHANACTI